MTIQSIVFSSLSKVQVRAETDQHIKARLLPLITLIRTLLPDDALGTIATAITSEKTRLTSLFPVPRAYDVTQSDERRARAGKDTLSDDEHYRRSVTRDRSIVAARAAIEMRLSVCEVIMLGEAAQTEITRLRDESRRTRKPVDRDTITALEIAAKQASIGRETMALLNEVEAQAATLASDASLQ